MHKIPEDIIDDVNKIAEALVVYKNEKHLSWTGAYKDVLDKIGLGNKKDDDHLLTNVVTRITRMGYDIEGEPFKLKKYK